MDTDGAHKLLAKWAQGDSSAMLTKAAQKSRDR
jgi:hypothetical protein